MWEQISQARQEEQRALPRTPIVITLPDGATREGVANQTTPLDVAKQISAGLAKVVVTAKVDDVLYDLSRPLTQSCRLELFKFDSEEGRKVFWHSSAHILGQAMEFVFGGQLCVGPALEEGFYYDMRMDRTASQADFEALDGLCASFAGADQPFQRLELDKEQALQMFHTNIYKQEIIRTKVPDGARCTAYRCGNLIDLCKGPHLPTTALVKALKCLKASSAYWLGKAENDSLQRIYGVSFPNDKMLKEFEVRRQKLESLDHRNIGKQQELFFFSPLSPGSCFFLPHGARIYNTLVNFIKKQYWRRGYQEVMTPNMFNFALWEKSGHAANYNENMFKLEVDKTQFGLKPMNCPAHCLIYEMRPRSYKELPLRLADFGALHRNEVSGALSGLTRVRRFQQDDAHIFCMPSQIQSEIGGVLNFLREAYDIFGFTFTLELSTRPEKFLGDIEVWNQAEEQLAQVLRDFGHPWKLNPGDGAFYGPKIDIGVQDAMRRTFQCATIQLDFQLPIRFDLRYVPEHSLEAGQDLPRPIIVHRAILGSVERMFGILCEHFEGKWPLWLSPRQAVIVPVSAKKHMAFAQQVQEQLHAENFYVDVDTSDDTLQKKIRNSQLSQYNYILVVGDQEVEQNVVNVRTRNNAVRGTLPVAVLLAELREKRDTYAKDV
eukprot:gnl/Spiro4/22461_TR11078_c0_g1_i1.p1 gnl/Spiro4/22461_TR11078_c0_g1~~gnl/Spiro4/22461_TR11078_c0_g1_i1.p1  ORF type:complete len:730 (+),score=258.26 gnl/Spiro4/22461_TR11078_c0_g1_i1:207-2192(+)